MTSQQRKVKLPNWSAIIGWVGIIGTILGIVGFFISDLPDLFGGPSEGLSEEHIIGTLSALQSEKENAELQLTQIAIADIQAANQATQEALDQEKINLQLTSSAIEAYQESVIATQNAIAAVTATANAVHAAETEVAEAAFAAQTATQDAANAEATEVAFYATATADALAQITPSPTSTPTPTPLPTATPAPAPAVDHRLVVAAIIQPDGEGQLQFGLQTATQIPETPQNGLAYVWLLDTDRNTNTGRLVQDIGVDLRVAVKFEDDVWVGTVRTVNEDGTFGDPQYFLDVTIGTDTVIGVVDPVAFGLPDRFDWVVHAELGMAAYPYLPEEGHYSYRP